MKNKGLIGFKVREFCGKTTENGEICGPSAEQEAGEASLAVRGEAILAAGRMFDMRETARRLFEERYSGIVEPWKSMLSKIAARMQAGPIQAALMLANPVSGNSLDGMELLLLVCAATDLCEESQPSPARAALKEGK